MPSLLAGSATLLLLVIVILPMSMPAVAAEQSAALVYADRWLYTQTNL